MAEAQQKAARHGDCKLRRVLALNLTDARGDWRNSHDSQRPGPCKDWQKLRLKLPVRSWSRAGDRRASQPLLSTCAGNMWFCHKCWLASGAVCTSGHLQHPWPQGLLTLAQDSFLLTKPILCLARCWSGGEVNSDLNP